MTKRPKPSPTKEPQWVAPVAAPVEVLQNHFNSIGPTCVDDDDDDDEEEEANDDEETEDDE
jgi:hypothetical protein